AQELDIGVAANHAGAGAGGIHQNPIVVAAVPERLRLAHIGPHEARRDTEPAKVLLHAAEALRVDVDGGELDGARRALEQVAGLAPRGSTGIEDPHTGRSLEQQGSELCAGVLYRHPPLLEAWERPDGGWPIEHHRTRAAAASRPLEQTPRQAGCCQVA